MTNPVASAGPAGLEELYTRFGPTIYARCRQILRDPTAAEDATHEVFFRIHHHLDRLPGPREALGWLYRAATNHCLNEVRNRRGRALAVETLPERPAADAEAHLCERDLVIRLVSELPAELALVAWLYHVDGLEQAEIALICRVSRRTVISRLARFNERARRFLNRSDQ
jgi:RNA polymerase sigma-70 factor (ECF subfamily)